MILQVTCRDCKGHGGYEETKIYGVTWATPHGYPDYIWHDCKTCDGEGTLPYDWYYETEGEAKVGEGLYDEDSRT